MYCSLNSFLSEETHVDRCISIELVSTSSTLYIKKELHNTLLTLIELVGIPSGIHCDLFPELITARFGKSLQNTVSVGQQLNHIHLGKTVLKAKVLNQ